MDTITLICTIIGGIGAIYGIITFYKQFAQKDKELRQALIAKFHTNRTLIIEIINTLTAYSQSHNANDVEFFQGVTFTKYIKYLKEGYENSLSDRTLNNLMTNKLPESIMQSMSKSLDDQFNNLSFIKGHFQLYFRDSQP